MCCCSWRSWMTLNVLRNVVRHVQLRCMRPSAECWIVQATMHRLNSQPSFHQAVSHASLLLHSSMLFLCWRNSALLTLHRPSRMLIFASAVAQTLVEIRERACENGRWYHVAFPSTWVEWTLWYSLPLPLFMMFSVFWLLIIVRCVHS